MEKLTERAIWAAVWEHGRFLSCFWADYNESALRPHKSLKRKTQSYKDY